MRAMILCAGRGERLRPLTDSIPKPLIEVGGQSLLVRHILALKAAGISKIVVNSAWLPEQIIAAVGDGSRFGVTVSHSREPAGGLETAGGIVNALELLGNEPFCVVNGDTYMQADYRQFLEPLPVGCLARIFLVPNPEHHPQGDFALNAAGLVQADTDAPGQRLTFSGAALYHPAAFAGMTAARAPLRPLLCSLARDCRLCGCLLAGRWFDVGTAERLAHVRAFAADTE